MKPIFTDSSALTKLFLTAFFAVSSFLFVLLIGMLIAVPLFDIEFMKFGEYLDHTNPDNIAIIKFFQIMQSIGMFIIPAFIAGFLFYNKNKGIFGFGLNKAPIFKTLVIASVAMIAGLPIINILAKINAGLSMPDALKFVEEWMLDKENYAQGLTEAFLRVDGINGLFLNIFMIGVLPAIGEELLFRGIIQRALTEGMKNAHAGILITSILFSALHMQFYGFLPRMVLGIFFGYLLVWSGNIWVPMLTHFINNTFAVLVAYFYFQDGQSLEIDNLGTNQETITWFVFSLLITGALIYSIWLTEKQNKAKQADV